MPNPGSDSRGVRIGSQADQNDAPAADARRGGDRRCPHDARCRHPRRGDRESCHDRRCARRYHPEAAVDTRWLDGRSRPATTDPAPIAPAATAARKPNKFMADLTKAMQSAAESARADRWSAFASTPRPTSRPSTPTPPTRRPTCASGRRRHRRRPRVVEGRDRPHPRGDRRAHQPPQGRARARDRGARRRDRGAHRARPGAGHRLRGRDGRRSSSGCWPRTIRRASPRWPRSLPEPPSVRRRRTGREPRCRPAVAVGRAESSRSTPEAAVETEAAVERRGRRGRPAARPRRDAVAETDDAPSPRSRHGRPTSRAGPAGRHGRRRRPVQHRRRCAGCRATTRAWRALGLTPDFAAAEAEAATFSTDDDGSSDEPSRRSPTTRSRLAWPASCRKRGATGERPRRPPAWSSSASSASPASPASSATCRAPTACSRVGVSSGPEASSSSRSPTTRRRAARRRPGPAGLRGPRHRRVRRAT